MKGSGKKINKQRITAILVESLKHGAKLRSLMNGDVNRKATSRSEINDLIQEEAKRIGNPCEGMFMYTQISYDAH